MKSEWLHEMVRDCLAKNDTDTVLKMLTIKSLLCCLDTRFSAPSELIEDAAERDLIASMLIKHNPGFHGSVYQVKIDVLPNRELTTTRHDNN